MANPWGVKRVGGRSSSELGADAPIVLNDTPETIAAANRLAEEHRRREAEYVAIAELTRRGRQPKPVEAARPIPRTMFTQHPELGGSADDLVARTVRNASRRIVPLMEQDVASQMSYAPTGNAGTAQGEWDKVIAAQNIPNRSVGELGGDVVLGVGAAANTLLAQGAHVAPNIAVDIANAWPRAIERLTGRAEGSLGRIERPNLAQDVFEGAQREQELARMLQTPQQRRGAEEIMSQDGIIDSFGAMLRNPASTLVMGAEQIPQLAPVAATLAFPLIGLGARLVVAGATAGVQSAGQVEADNAARVARGELTPQQAADLQDFAFTGSVLANSVLPKAIPGGTAFERIGLPVAGRATTRLGGAVRGTLGEAIAGGGSEYLDQVIQNVATGRPATEGAAPAAALGAVLEGPLGGLAGFHEGGVAANEEAARRQAMVDADYNQRRLEVLSRQNREARRPEFGPFPPPEGLPQRVDAAPSNAVDSSQDRPEDFDPPVVVPQAPNAPRPLGEPVIPPPDAAENAPPVEPQEGLQAAPEPTATPVAEGVQEAPAEAAPLAAEALGEPRPVLDDLLNLPAVQNAMLAMRDRLAAVQQEAQTQPEVQPEKVGEKREPVEAPVEVSAEPVEPPVEQEVQDEPPTESEVEGNPVREIPIAGLRLSQDVPQFKSGADSETGVVEPLEGKFDRRGVGPIQVWQRKDGRMEVISGRHRLDLARRSGERTIPAQVYREADGFTAEQAAMLDAELNIRDGQGKVKDYVQYFQSGITRQEAESRGLLARSTGKRAFTIASEGTSELIAAHQADQITDEAAVAIAQAAPNNEALQNLGMKLVLEGTSIQNAANMMRAATGVRGAVTQSGDLFGFDNSAIDVLKRMAAYATKKQREIAERLAAVRGAAKRPELARKEGVDVNDPEAVRRRVAELEHEKHLWERWEIHPELMAETREAVGLPRDDFQLEQQEQKEEVRQPEPEAPGLFAPPTTQERVSAAERAKDAERNGLGRDVVRPEQGEGDLLAGPRPEQTDVADVEGRFANNKVFTQERVYKAQATLRAARGRLNSGVDPELLAAGATVAGAYIEAGIRDFARFAADMVGKFGEAIRPHLQAMWDRAMTEAESRQEVETLPPEPKPSEPRQPEPPKPVESRKPAEEEGTTGTKNAVTAVEREARGKPAEITLSERAARNLPPDIPYHAKTLFEEAARDLEENPDIGYEVVRRSYELNDAGGLTTYEEAVMIVHKRHLMNEREALDAKMEKARESGNEREQVSIARQLAELEEQLTDVDIAAYNRGRAWGRWGNIRQRELRRDFSLAELERRERVQFGKLTPQRKRVIAAQAKEIERAGNEVEEAEARRANVASEEGVARMVRRQRLAARRTGKTVQQLGDFIHAKAVEARKRFAQTPDVPSRRGQSGAVMSPAVFADAAWVAADIVYSGVTKFAEFAAAMTEAIGDKFADKFPRLFKEGKRLANGGKPSDFASLAEQVRDSGIAEPEMIRRLVREQVELGETEEPVIMQNIAEATGLDVDTVRDKFAQTEHREVSRSQAQRIYDDLKRVAELQAQIKRLKEGSDPEVKLSEREVSERVRELERERDQLLKDSREAKAVANRIAKLREKLEALERGEDGAARGERIKRAVSEEEQEILDKIKSLKAKNSEAARIAALEEQLDAALRGELPEKSGATRMEASARVRELREQIKQARKTTRAALRDAERIAKLQVKLENLRNGITQPKSERRAVKRSAKEQAIRDEIKRLESANSDSRRVAKIQEEIDRLKRGEKGERQKGAKREESPLVREKRAELAELRRKLRKEGETDRRVSKIEERIKYWEDRLRDGDFSRLPKRQRVVDQRVEEARARLGVAKHKYLATFEKEKYKNLGPARQALHKLGHVVPLMRTLQTIGDVSAVIRQGKPVFGHPIIGTKVFFRTLKALVSRAHVESIRARILNSPNFNLYRDAKLELRGIEEAGHGKSDEFFDSELIDSFPKIGREIIHGFERQFTWFLNDLQVSVFDSLHSLAPDAPPRAIARLINDATGRADLQGEFGEKFQAASPLLSMLFFAPRFALANLRLLTGRPLWQAESGAKLLVLSEYARMMAGYAVVMSLMSLGFSLRAGDDDDKKPTITFDPRTSDAMRIKVGDTRIDITGGIAPWYTLLGRIATGEKLNAGGKLNPLYGKNRYTYSELMNMWFDAGLQTPARTKSGDRPFGSEALDEAVMDFLRYKQSPAIGAFFTALTGENAVHQPQSLPMTALLSFTPLVAQDLMDASKGDIPMMFAIPATMLGVGMNTYGKDGSRQMRDVMDSYNVTVDSITAELATVPMEQWQEKFDELKAQYGPLMEGLQLAVYKRDGKYGKEGEYKRDRNGRPVLEPVTGGDGGYVPGELNGYRVWRDGKPDTTEGARQRGEKLKNIMDTFAGRTDLTGEQAYNLVEPYAQLLPHSGDLYAQVFTEGGADKPVPSDLRDAIRDDAQAAIDAQAEIVQKMMKDAENGISPARGQVRGELLERMFGEDDGD